MKWITQKSRPRLRGRWRRSRQKGQVWAETKKSFLRNVTKYLPVILERSEESGQRIRVLNTLFAIILCRILRYHSSRCGSVLLIRILLPLKNDGRGASVFLWYSDLCTPTCPYRLARLGSSPVFGGSERLRKKEFIVFYISQTKEYWNGSHKKLSPFVGGRCQPTGWRKG